MGFGNYAKQAPQPGKTVPYTLFGLRNPDGTSPILHVEYLGEENRAYWLELLAKAKAQRTIGTSPAEIDRDNREAREENRETVIDHSARRVENAFHDDGTPATDKDIRAIVLALPRGDFEALWRFVQNYQNFRDFKIAEDPAALAEK